MKREIKFKAVTKDGRIVNPDYLDRNGVAWWKEDSIPVSSDEVIFFTGFFDKNLKEIWEGHIVFCEGKNWEVVFDYGGWEMVRKECFIGEWIDYTIRSKDPPDDPGFTDWGESIVVSDIRKSPELVRDPIVKEDGVW